MTKAFAYLRVSGKSQIDGDGFPRQLAAVMAYAGAHGIEVARVFEEEGVRGATELENRPALLSMLEALAENGTKLVLIEKLDRLARDLMVQETIISDLRKRGFEIVSVMEPDLLENDPTRILMRQIFGAIAQYEKAMIVAKLRGARQRMKAKTGRCEGRKPYGLTPEEADTIDRIRELRSAGYTFDGIAGLLDSIGVKAPLGSRWHPKSVERIAKRGVPVVTPIDRKAPGKVA